MNTYTTLTNLDIVNPTLNFISEVSGIEEINIKPLGFSKTKIIDNRELKYDIKSYYFINSEENKLFSALQQLIETKKNSNEVKKVKLSGLDFEKQKQIKLRIFQDDSDLLEELDQFSYQFNFTVSDLLVILENQKDSYRKSIKKRLDNLVKKLNHITIDIEINEKEKNIKKVLSTTPLFKVSSVKFSNKETIYTLNTSILDFWNLKNKSFEVEYSDSDSKILASDKIIEKDFENNLGRFTTKNFNEFYNFKGIEINIATLLFYTFKENKNQKQHSITVDDCLIQLYKHENWEEELMRIKEGYYTKKAINELNLTNLLRERRKYIRTKLNAVIKKTSDIFNIKLENNQLIQIEKILRKEGKEHEKI